MPAPRLAAAAACLVLAGCQTWAPAESLAGGGRDSERPAEVDEAKARLFVETLNAVEPVVEAECQRQGGPAKDCDFLMLVDDRPRMQPNAYQTVGRSGRPLVIVTVSLIAEARNADEIAFVVAHEAAHHILHHLEMQDQVAEIGAEILGNLESVASDSTPDSIREAREIGAAVGARTYSKEWELEADALGALLAGAAGFDPVQGVQIYLRYPDPGDEVLGTHPSNAERIAIVEAAASGRIDP